MGFTAIEKVLARVSRDERHRAGVAAGTLLYPEPDMVMIHDALVTEAKKALDAAGIAQIHAPAKTMMVSDHDVLYGSERAAQRGAFNRKAAKTWRIENFYDVGRGGHGHIFPLEDGLVVPGMFYFDNDTHATNAGAVGAFGLRVGGEISRVLATGTTWVPVPQSVRLELRGRLGAGVYARDVGFYLARSVASGRLPFDLDYRVLEYTGDLDQFGLGARVALCSTATELRAAGVYVPPSDRILAYCHARAQRPMHTVYPDLDAHYDATGFIDLAEVGPQVVLPGDVTRATDIGEAVGTAVDHAFIGSCGSGMYDDLLVAASVLKGRRLAPGTRLFVVPGSERSTRRLLADGLMQVFLDAGAIVLPAGCGPCNDAVVGPLGPGEVSISTATNNNAGRFGPRDASLFLGSPATVAASAVAGRITDPRTVSADAAVLDTLETCYAESFWTLRGRCLKLGHDVPHANGIVPLRLITGRETDPAKITPHLFEQLAPGFASECKPGDIVVTGRRFGMGPKVPGYIGMRALGLGLLCESMPVQAYRAALGEGLRVLSPCAGVLDACETGDLLEVDFATGRFSNETRGLTRTFAPLPPELQELVLHGGTAGWLVQWARANTPAAAPHPA